MKGQCEICDRWLVRPELRVLELDETYVTLFPDQYFYGYLLVHTKKHYVEPLDMDVLSFQTMMEEVMIVAEALKKVVQPTKINYQLLGNMAPHIHWHITPRSEGDSIWPSPHWLSNHVPVELEASRREALIKALRVNL